MDQTAVSFPRFAADRLSRDRAVVTRDWVQKLSGQMGIRPRRVLPHRELLDHIPEVLGQAVCFVRDGEAETLTAGAAVGGQMKDLAHLRRSQGYDLQEVIREFDELARILDGAGLRWLDEYPGTPAADEVGIVFGRLSRVPVLMAEVTAGYYEEQEMESRLTNAAALRGFTETLLHQIRGPLGAAESAALLLESDVVADPAERRRFVGLIRRNLVRARAVVDDVQALALSHQSHVDTRRVLRVGEALGEVLLETREFLAASGVRLELEEPIPDMAVDASRVEVVLLNLITNAVKYSDPDEPVRWVRVGFARDEMGQWWLQVSDNGLGIDPAVRERIFERFSRASGRGGGHRAGAGDRARGDPADGQPPGAGERAGAGNHLPVRAPRAPGVSHTGCIRRRIAVRSWSGLHGLDMKRSQPTASARPR